MDTYEEDSTQPATQKALDPRRIGQQNSGFSDEDLADIICFLVPNSEYAREQVSRIRLESSLHIVARDNVEQVRLKYDVDDDPHAFKPTTEVEPGPHAIVLRLSADVKDAAMGFTFGRNPRCDIVLTNDPLRRLSNVHFRIYINEHGVLMLEDRSTNGTIVDGRLLGKKYDENGIRRTLTSGSIIKVLMHKTSSDLNLLVRVPRREGEHADSYKENLYRYMQKLAMLSNDSAATIIPGLGGPVDLFAAVPQRRPGAIDVQSPATPGPRPISYQTMYLSGHDWCWSGSSRYEKVCEIGRGAFATVYQVTSKFDGKPYAAKELDKRRFMKKGVLDQKVETEMNILRLVNHDNVVKLIETIDWENKLLILIMELVQGGDLGKLINSRGPLTQAATIAMTRQLVDALAYLHDRNVTHRDVKPDNILVASQRPFVVKLTDFGLSKIADNEDTFLKTFCGTLLYCAPEVYAEYTEYDERGRRNPRNRRHQLQGQRYGPRYDQAVDIWSLGGVLFYALTAEAPFPVRSGTAYTELLHQIMTTLPDTSRLEKRGISCAGINMVSRMLERCPEKRATAAELLQHPWLANPGNNAEPHPSQEFQHLSLEGNKENHVDDALVPSAQQSDDEILDDFLDDDKENDVMEYESEKENTTFGPGNPPRLFGEVAVSAIGSSGAMPSRLNLPVSGAGELEKSAFKERSVVLDSFESESSSTIRDGPKSRSTRATSKKVGREARSPSLSGTESILENLNMKSRGPRLVSGRSDLGASKRKPHDTSGDMDGDSPSRPAIKKLRSEALETSVLEFGHDDAVDTELFAQFPPININTGRQIDHPVHKTAYWSAQDSQTWHLNYPEMTQLQLDAFKAAAGARGEGFDPRSALWKLAFQFFPPQHYLEACSRRRSSGTSQKSSTAEPCASVVPNLASSLLDSQEYTIPDTQTDSEEPDTSKSAQRSSEGKMVVAQFESSPESAVKHISVLVTEFVASWGRARDNTLEHAAKNDIKVPKYGFRLVLWKEGFHPGKDQRPWDHRGLHHPDSFHFYISTKANNGIWVNGVHLPSHESKNPCSPSRNWIRIHHRDLVDVWSLDGIVTRLIFSCFWGGSAQPRPYSDGRISTPKLEPDVTARKLDETFVRAQKRLPELLKYEQMREEATLDAKERRLTVDRERERSRLFEAYRQQAVQMLATRPGFGSSICYGGLSRRGSGSHRPGHFA